MSTIWNAPLLVWAFQATRLLLNNLKVSAASSLPSSFGLTVAELAVLFVSRLFVAGMSFRLHLERVFMSKKRVVVATKPKIDAAVKKSDSFGRFSTHASTWVGSKWAFLGAVLIIIVWAAVGPLFHFSDTWQLVINTGTTIVTFLMVFLIQNTQNRDARAINLKLDELIHATEGAGNQIIDIESLTDKELDELHSRYERIRSEWMERGVRKTKSEVSQEHSGK